MAHTHTKLNFTRVIETSVRRFHCLHASLLGCRERSRPLDGLTSSSVTRFTVTWAGI